MSVRRIYVEKKPEYAVRAGELFEDIKTYLGISGIARVRVLVRYDIENIEDSTYAKARGTIFSEPPLDLLYEEDFPRESGDLVFSAEYLPGQFDQRADSAEQCVRLIDKDAAVLIRTATTYVLSGKLDERELKAIKNFCINPVDSRECAEEKPATLRQNFPAPEDVKTVEGFVDMPENEFRELYASFGLAMTYEDFLEIRRYFASEKRNPTVTEIRVLDTYWSDHCRHTTFQTELTKIAFLDGDFRERLTKTYERYLRDHEDLLGGRSDKFICLMDLALMGMRRLKRDGKLTDQEETDEINACSVVVPITVDGKEEEWLVNFKNETHNHPTEIEPFGGAATFATRSPAEPMSIRQCALPARRIRPARSQKPCRASSRSVSLSRRRRTAILPTETRSVLRPAM